jgi:mRNA-degrading endonuclease RelE of RelBE toxin-antitoxin system
MEKKYKLLLTDTALVNLESIPDHYIIIILERIELLEKFPELGPVIDHSKWKGYRQLLVDYYWVIYSIDQKQNIVNVLFIKHGRMDTINQTKQ